MCCHSNEAALFMLPAGALKSIQEDVAGVPVRKYVPERRLKHSPASVPFHSLFS